MPRKRKMRTGHRPQDPGGEFGAQLDRAQNLATLGDCWVCDNEVKVGVNYTELPADEYYERRIVHTRSCGYRTLPMLEKYITAYKDFSPDVAKGTFELYPEAMEAYLEKRPDVDLRSAVEIQSVINFIRETAMQDGRSKRGGSKVSTSTTTKGGKKAMAKKNTKETRGRKGFDKVEVDKRLLEHPVIGEHVKAVVNKPSSDRAAVLARRELRKVGFKLSDKTTWTAFLKSKRAGAPAKKAKDEKKGKATKAKGTKKEEKKTSKKDAKKAKSNTKGKKTNSKKAAAAI